MGSEIALVEAVRDRAGHQCPAAPGVAGAAVAVALGCLAGGASVGEACEQADAFVRSWIDHPSHRPPRGQDRYPLAS